MLRVKKRVIYVSIILLFFVLMGRVVHAAESASSEVHITIETSQTAAENKEMKSVNTSDQQMHIRYGIMLCVSILVLLKYIIKMKKSSFWLPVALLLFLLIPQTTHAEETSNVDVTVPSKLSVVFEADGTTSVSDFAVCNHTLLPMSIKKIYVVEKNDWKLCGPDISIPVDTKRIELIIEQSSIGANENNVDIPIGYDTSKDLDIQIRRGAWTLDYMSEEALQLEFEYEFGTREFALSFNSSGGEEVYEERMVTNGTVTELPTPFRVGYEFTGWADSTGRSYKDQYTMPIRDECLTARWRAVSGYVLYLEDDQSLRFVYPTEPISVGDMYDNTTVTAIYAIRKNAAYSSVSQVPWYDYNMYKTTVIKKVIIEDVIQPKSTAYWFHNMRDCEVFQLEKLDTSQVVDMSYMFGWAGYNVKEFEITGLGSFDVSQVKKMRAMFTYMAYNAANINLDIQKWKVYNVTDMSQMFAYMGYNSTAISVGLLADWEVVSVTNMDSMFQLTGYCAKWYVYLVPWDVSNVTTHVDFNLGVNTKVIPPIW